MAAGSAVYPISTKAKAQAILDHLCTFKHCSKLKPPAIDYDAPSQMRKWYDKHVQPRLPPRSSKKRWPGREGSAKKSLTEDGPPKTKRVKRSYALDAAGQGAVWGDESVAGRFLNGLPALGPGQSAALRAGMIQQGQDMARTRSH